MPEQPIPDPPNRDHLDPNGVGALALVAGLAGTVITLVGLAHGSNGEGPFLHLLEGIMSFFPSAMWGAAVALLVKISGGLPTRLPPGELRPAHSSEYQPGVQLSPDRALVRVRQPRRRVAQWIAHNALWWTCVAALATMLGGTVLVGMAFGSSWAAVVPMFGTLAGILLAIVGFFGAALVLRPFRGLREADLSVTPHWLTLPDGTRIDAGELSWAWRPVVGDLWVLEAVGTDGGHHTCCAGTLRELNGVASCVDRLLRPGREDFQGEMDPQLAALRRQTLHA